MMTDAVALAKERSAAKTAGFWYKFKIGVAVFLKYFSLIFVAFMMLLPLVSCFVTAAKTDKEYQSTSVMDMPKNWFNFDNYVQAWTTQDFARYALNSFIVAVISTALSVLQPFSTGVSSSTRRWAASRAAASADWWAMSCSAAMV